MAEAIASALLQEMDERVTKTSVLSAGVGAADGAPIADDAVAALKEMGIEKC
jgi:protein-tyrosine-phosphatase